MGLEPAHDRPNSEMNGVALYVRPHELVIQRHKNDAASLEANVLHVNPTG